MRIFLPFRLLIEVLKRTAQQFAKDQVGDLAAALTYYAIFSLFPLLLLLVTIASLVFNAEEARRTVLDSVSRFAPGETAQVLSDTVATVLEKRDPGANLIATITGIAGLLFSSSGVFTTLDKSINRAWGCEYKESLIKDRLLSFGMVLSIAIVMFFSLILAAAIAFAQTTSNFFLKTFLGGILDLAILWQILTALVPILLNTAILILVFRLLPKCEVRVREVWLGALLTAVGWEILKQGFAFYLGNFANNANVYGTLGAFFSLITWIYLSSLLLLTGAEFTSEYGRALRLYEGQKIPAGARASAAGVNPSPSARVWRGAKRNEE